MIEPDTRKWNQELIESIKLPFECTNVWSPEATLRELEERYYRATLARRQRELDNGIDLLPLKLVPEHNPKNLQDVVTQTLGVFLDNAGDHRDKEQLKALLDALAFKTPQLRQTIVAILKGWRAIILPSAQREAVRRLRRLRVHYKRGCDASKLGLLITDDFNKVNCRACNELISHQAKKRLKQQGEYHAEEDAEG